MPRVHRFAAVAGAAGAVLRAALVAVLALRGLAGLALVAYGAWLVYEPAGPIVVGLGLLADRLGERRTGQRGDRPGDSL